MSADPFDLARFVSAQAGVFDQAVEELRAGRKRTHWMWFVFPQLRGLGSSSTAQFYGISALDEATAYLQHPVLGPRLELAVSAVQSSPAPSLNVLLGSPDDLKFRSSMTLFAIADPEGPYQAALKPPAPARPPADRSKLDAAEKALGELDERRKREEADFRREADDLEARRAAAQSAYVEARKAATSTVVDARSTYRKAGGAD